jgi:hypothetical protein
MQYCVIQNGGGTQNAYGQQAGIVVSSTSSTVSIRDCFIDGSGGYGIDLGGNTNANQDIATANTFSNCAQGNVKN